MLVDDSYSKRVVMQPETEYEQAVLSAMQDVLKGLPAGETGGILSYFTADVDRYPRLDEDLQEDADYWKDVGYRALVILWRR